MNRSIRIFFLIFLTAMVAMNISAGPERAEIVRLPAVSGLFYPSDGEELSKVVNGHLDNVSGLPEINGQIIALIVPHAGLVYSGQIAAYSYKTLKGSGINKVILCGPAHRYRFEGISVYGPGVSWQTPVGMIKCDDNLCQQLIDQDRKIAIIPSAHQQEHCIEVQLPYLKSVLNDFTLVPALMGQPSASTVNILADALAAIDFDDKTVMVASTDWQHYHPASVGWPMDSLGIECLEKLDPDLLQKYLTEGKVEACGGGSAAAVIKAAIKRGANKAKLLKYGDSGDITGDKNSVVSYIAAVIYKEKDSGLPEKADLTDDEKKTLLKIARQSIETYLKTNQIPDFDVSDKLKEPGAAFVTLNKGHQLRGCIGYTEAVEPLYKTVAQCAIQAAVSDPRFHPVKQEELNKIHIEISVLTPLQKVESFDEIEVGRDGLMIFKGRSRGLLLPQVATDYKWNRDEFLRQTCRKAGLPLEAYKSKDAEIYKFQAIIFAEKE